MIGEENPLLLALSECLEALPARAIAGGELYMSRMTVLGRSKRGAHGLRQAFRVA